MGDGFVDDGAMVEDNPEVSTDAATNGDDSGAPLPPAHSREPWYMLRGTAHEAGGNRAVVLQRYPRHH